MEYVRVVKGKGCKYVVNNNLLISQYCIRNSKRYVKCDMCSASGYIDCDKFFAVKLHSQHDDQSQEIQRLQFVENGRKRAAEEPTESLRRIFDRQTQSSGSTAAATVAFNDIESSVYKRLRKQMPLLLTTAADVSLRIVGTRYETFNGQPFFRGSVSSSGGARGHPDRGSSFPDRGAEVSAGSTLPCKLPPPYFVALHILRGRGTINKLHAHKQELTEGCCTHEALQRRTRNLR